MIIEQLVLQQDQIIYYTSNKTQVLLDSLFSTNLKNFRFIFFNKPQVFQIHFFQQISSTLGSLFSTRLVLNSKRKYYILTSDKKGSLYSGKRNVTTRTRVDLSSRNTSFVD